MRDLGAQFPPIEALPLVFIKEQKLSFQEILKTKRIEKSQNCFL